MIKRVLLAALLLFLPWQAWAAIGTPAELGNGDANNETSCQITTSATAPAGDTIIFFFGVSGTATVNSVTDSAGNSYTQDATGSQGSEQAWLYRSSNITQLTSSGTITATYAAAENGTCVALSVSGLTNVSPVDQTNVTTGNGGTGTASVTTTNADDLVIGAVAINGSTSPSQPGGWTAMTGVTSSLTTIIWAYRIETSTGTFTYDPTSLGNQWVDIVASYEAAPPPPPPAMDALLTVLGVGATEVAAGGGGDCILQETGGADEILQEGPGDCITQE